MKKILLLIPLLFLGAFTFASEEFPAFPMTIYGNIKNGSTDLAGGTLKVYNSSNQELTSYDITQPGKYGSDNVSILPLSLNKFIGNLNFKVSYNGKTFVVDSIDDSNRGEGCPSKNSITFVSNDCRYDIILKEDTSSSSSSSGQDIGYSGRGRINKPENDESKNKSNPEKTENNTTTGKTIKSEDNPKKELINKPSFIQGNPKEVLKNGYTIEQNNAYNFAHANGITTASNISKANMNSSLTRIAMAKMLSNYTINVLGKTPDVSKGSPKYNDVTKQQNEKYDNGVTLAYQLGIMGQNMKNNKFRPNDEVTRAEFATALSRMLYGTKDGSNKYYSTHISTLYNKGIISDTNPKNTEKRGRVMLMLMRSAQ